MAMAVFYVIGSVVLSILALFAGLWIVACTVCLNSAPSMPTMTASAWTAGSSGTFRR